MNSKRKIIVGAVVVTAAIGIGSYLYYTRGFDDTDNAYVAGHIHQISSRVNGTVSQVNCEDFQSVKAGDILVKIDPTDLKVELERTQADLMQAIANGAKADADYSRLSNLARINAQAISKQEVDSARAARDTAAARQRMTVAALDTVKLQLTYTEIRAPISGRVGKKNVEVGQRIQPGQALLAVVSSDKWIVANFKETQTQDIAIGQLVFITLDSFPDKKFEGTVESIAPAAGSQFALLPPDNATGNFTKIVQRIPVKILFKPATLAGFEDRVVPGMSANVKVKVK